MKNINEQNNLNPNDFIVGGGNVPQQQRMYTPNAESPSFFGNLIGKAIEFKMMGSILKNSIVQNLGGVAAGATVASASSKVGLISRVLASTGTALAPLMANPYFWIGVGVVSVGSWGYFYLKGNPNMYEIEEIWNDGKHKEKDIISKEVYNTMGSTLHHCSFIGSSVIQKIFNEENIYMRVDIKNQNVASVFDRGIYGISKTINDTKKIYNNPNLDYWINKTKENYLGLNVSGSKNTKDYSTIKSYVTKYSLENEYNMYGVELAEEAEGWYDTFFGTMIPGMSSFGFSSYSLSSEYLNNINGLNYLDGSRKFLYKILDSYWKNKVTDLKVDFNIETLSNFIVWATGSSYLTSVDLKEVQICVRNNDINSAPDVKYSMDELLRLVGKKMQDEINKYVSGQYKLSHTNVTVAFATYCACFTIMDILTTSFSSQVAMYEAFKKQKETEIKRIEQEKIESSTEYRSKYSDDVINKLMTNIDFSKYDG